MKSPEPVSEFIKLVLKVYGFVTLIIIVIGLVLFAVSHSDDKNVTPNPKIKGRKVSYRNIEHSEVVTLLCSNVPIRREVSTK